MKLLGSYWFYIIAAMITIIGLVTGWYLFFLLVIPLDLFNFNEKDRDE